jgi:homoserine kinase
VRVPATCANLGPGFDCLALALALHNEFEAHLLAGDAGAQPPVVVTGAPVDTSQIATDASNLFVRAFGALCERIGVRPPPLAVQIAVHLPPGRGLGSSATAVVGGILAANALCGDPLSTGELLELAVACEQGGHADNVAAALLGGLVVTGARDAANRLTAISLPVPDALRAVLFIPDTPMSTVQGRALLPVAYPREDVTFNLSRVALLLGALQTERYELLATAMGDRIHQPYRARVFPALDALVAAAQAAGAHGACLSGGGSSVLALATSHTEAIRLAMEARARALGVSGRGLITSIARDGAQATVLDETRE